jgi:hypothetical protein
MALEGKNLFKRSDLNVRLEESQEIPAISEGEIVMWHKTGGAGESATVDAASTGLDGTPDYWGQNFIIGHSGQDGDFLCSGVTWGLRRLGLPGTVTVECFAVDGSGHPTGAALATGTTSGDSLPNAAVETDAEYREISFVTPITLSQGSTYAVIVRAAVATAANKLVVHRASVNTVYSGGTGIYSDDSGASWINSAFDSYFKILGKGDYMLINLFGTVKQVSVVNL